MAKDDPTVAVNAPTLKFGAHTVFRSSSDRRPLFKVPGIVMPPLGTEVILPGEFRATGGPIGPTAPMRTAKVVTVTLDAFRSEFVSVTVDVEAEAT